MIVHQSIDVRASVGDIYSLAQDIANWPNILPHYSSVRVVVETCDERVAVMSARRDWIPVRWTAAQQLLPTIPRIEFTHLSGWATGMRVAWIFDPIPHGTKVTISHDLAALRVPLVRSRLGREIVAGFFIAPIASLTLAGMKAAVESRHE
jgi:ribosome-associated toxin RatA of RatAB toxin-antitoxin module